MSVINNSNSVAFADLCQAFKARANELAEYAQLSSPEDTKEKPDSSLPIIKTFLQLNSAESNLIPINRIVNEIRRFFLQKCEQFSFTLGTRAVEKKIVRSVIGLIGYHVDSF